MDGRRLVVIGRVSSRVAICGISCALVRGVSWGVTGLEGGARGINSSGLRQCRLSGVNGGVGSGWYTGEFG